MGGTERRLKKRSDASRLLDVTTFLLDRSFGSKKLSAALRAAGAKVEIHEDHFPSIEKDDSSGIATFSSTRTTR